MEYDEKSALVTMLKCKLEAKLDVPWQKMRELVYSSQLNHFNLILDSHSSKAIGYVCWAKVAIPTIDRAIRYSVFPKYFYEWNEGNILLIVDACFNKDAFTHVRRLLRHAKSSNTSIAYKTKRGFKFLRYS